MPTGAATRRGERLPQQWPLLASGAGTPFTAGTTKQVVSVMRKAQAVRFMVDVFLLQCRLLHTKAEWRNQLGRQRVNQNQLSYRRGSFGWKNRQGGQTWATPLRVSGSPHARQCTSTTQRGPSLGSSRTHPVSRCCMITSRLLGSEKLH